MNVQRKPILLLFLILSIFSLLLLNSVVYAQTAKKLQILIPGMSAAPYTGNGYEGDPEDQTTGKPFNVMVNAVDDDWNIVPISDQVFLSASDPLAELPLPVNLINGTATLSIVLNSGGLYAITAYDDSDPTVNSSTTPPVRIVSIDYFAVGSIGDPFSGVPGQVKVGEDITNVEITARNRGGDIVTKYNGRVYLSELTDYGYGRLSPQVIQLTNGKWNGNLNLYRAGKKQASWGVTGDVWLEVSDGLPVSDQMEIIINCDDAYDLYVNGVYVGSNSQYNVAQTYIAPYNSGNNVLAVKGRNNSSVGGLIVEMRVNGNVILRSDKNWSYSSVEQEGWTKLNFDDSGWSPVNDLGVYGISPWGKNVSGFPESSYSHWIWGNGDVEYFRSTFYIDDSIPPSTPFTPHMGESNRFCAIPESFDRLLAVLPGEEYLPGSRSGRIGLPLDQLTGNEFSVDVYATDMYWNHISTNTDVISLSSSDPNANIPFNKAMIEGKANMNITLNTPGLQTVTVSDISNGTILSHTSTSVTILEMIDHFVFSTISSPQVVGQAFQVSITAVDQFGVPANNFSGILDITASTGVQTISPTEIYMVNSVWTGNVMLTKAESYINISVQDRTNPPHTGYSNQFNVVAGQISKLQVLLPGESTTPGISPGKKGTVNDILAGSSINVRVNAVDAFWNVITNSSDVVHFVSSDPLAGLPPDSPLNMGTRQVVITLNSTGLQTVSAFDLTSPQVSPATSTQIRVNPGNLDRFVFDQIYGPKFVGTPFSVKINAVDLLGNLVSAYSGLVTLSASTGDGTIVPVTANFINGTWTGNITLKKAAGGVFLHASDNATPPHSGTSKEFEVKPGTLAGFQVIVPGLSATPGVSPGYIGTPKAQNVGRPFSININGVDEYWNVVTTANDSFGVSSTDILASLPEPTKLNFGSKNLSITLNEDGSHTISAFHLNNQQVLNGQTPLITVLPQNLDHFSFNQISDPVVVGQPFQITIRAETNENDRVFGFQGNLNLSASTGDGTIIPKIVGPFEDGEWTGEIILTLASNEVTLFANDGGTPSHTGTSNPFTVLSGDFKKLQVLLPGENPQAGSFLGKTGLPLDQQTGEQFEVIIRAVDEYWNLVSSINDSIKIQSSDSLAIFTKKSKMINGSASLTFIMGSAGRHIITAEDITDIEKLAGISSSFNINPGNLDHFELQTISNQIAGNEFLITITAADVAGNPVTGFNGHARLKSSTGDDTFSPSEIDFVDGVWTGKLIITKASENVYLTCLDFAANPHTGQSNVFKINPGEFTRLQILLNGETSTPGIAPGKTGNIQTQIAGEAVLVTVNAVDNWWNPIPSANGSIGLTSTDINANLPMDADLISGTVTFSDMRFLTPGYWTITSHCKSNPQISSDTSPLIHVITGSIASFTFEAINSPQVVGDTISVTIRAVDGNRTTVSAYSEKASVTVSTGPGTIIIEDVQFQNGIWSGPVVLTRAAQSVHFNIHDFDDIVRGNSNPFTLLPGNLARLQILLPGETATPGLNQAKEGQPHSQIVGVPFQIKVNATDKWWNQVKPENLNLHFSSSDMIANLPKDTSQTTSFSNYTITLLTVGDNKIIVQSNDRPELVDTSSVVYVQSGELDHFVFSKIDNAQKAGHAFSVRIDAHNQFDFPVTDYQGDIILSASTGNGTISKTGIIMTNGYWEGELYVTKADSNVNLFASDYIPSPNTHTGYSNSFSVQSDSLAGLQVILPGETITPGVTPGKRGDPLTYISGTSVNIMFRAVDSYWNLISNRTDTLTIAVTDSFAILPDIVTFENGFTEIPITFRTANQHQIIANVVNPKSFEEAKSDTLQIFPNVFTQLLLLLPGEKLLPGDNENDPLKTPGRIGQALKQTSGLPFNVEILAVDNYWNQVVDSPSDKIHLFTTDNLAKISPIDTVLQRGKARFSVTLTQGGNQVLRAINDSNTQIRTSLDGVVGVLVGGLHYEVVLSTDKIAAGYEFNMQIVYKNGIGELVASANHLVHLSLVTANDVSQTLGTLNNNSFDLQGGSRIIKQIINSVGLVRIKVEDEIGTQPAYSDPLEVFAGDVTSIEIDAPRSEIRGLEEVTLSAKLADHAGNPVSNYEVQFSVISGSGELKQPTGLSDPEGMVSVGFKAGRISELNIVRAQVDTIFADFEIITNLTPSTQPDGIPVNYPNPFGVESDFTSIDYYLAEDADVTLQIYDLFGNFVWSKNISAGTPGGLGRSNSSTPNSVPWQGLNDQGHKVGNGGYILVAIAVANGKTIMNAQRKIAVLR